MANWEHLTEILPKPYRNLTEILQLPALAPLYFASLCSITSRKPLKRQPGQYLRACRIEASNLLPMRILAINTVGIYGYSVTSFFLKNSFIPYLSVPYTSLNLVWELRFLVDLRYADA